MLNLAIFWLTFTFIFEMTSLNYFFEVNISILAIFLISIITTFLCIQSQLKYYDYYLKDVKKFKSESLKYFLFQSTVFVILSKIIIYGFSKELNRRIAGREDNLFFLIHDTYCYYSNSIFSCRFLVLIFIVLIITPLILNYLYFNFFFFNKNKLPNKNLPNKIVFKDAKGLFEYQCKFGSVDIKPKHAIAALVLDGKDYSLNEPVRKNADGSQTALLKVASRDDGFLVLANTPSNKGEPLLPNDIVAWVPTYHDKEIAQTLKNVSSGWIGYIRAKLSLEMDTMSGSPTILSNYD